jgi:L-fuconolactonase
MPADYDQAIGDIPIRSLVAVEANPAPADALREARWFDALGAIDSRVAAIVAYVALDKLDRDQRLEELAAMPRVKGIRHNIQGEPRGFCLRPEFVDGVRAVGQRGFTFDLCATHDQLGEVVELVTRCPDTPFVLDHCGKPAIRDRVFEPWKAHIRALAERENIVCKLSGLLTEAGPHCSDDDLIPYADHVIESFSTDRVMYGSDWPVLTLAGRYSRWFEFTDRLTSGWSPDERRAFFFDTATRSYMIGVVEGPDLIVRRPSPVVPRP